MDEASSSALLSQRDPPPFRVVNAGSGADFFIVCDHAGRRVPERLKLLGAPAEAFDLHIAQDIGAEGVAVRLAERLGVPAVLQTYSRLVIDCNREPSSAAAIPAVSDGMRIPANENLSQDERGARIREVFDPYHGAIGAELDALLDAGRRPVLVALHSFTPQLGGVVRPWTYGVLHDEASRFSQAMLALLRQEEGEAVGDNAPYAMDGTDFTVPHHVRKRGLDYLELEIRQDLIADAHGQDRAAALLSRLLPEALRCLT